VKTLIMRAVLAVSVLVMGLEGQARAQAPANTSIVEALGFLGAVTDNGGATFGGGMQFGAGRLIFAAEVGYLTLSDDFDESGVDVDSSGLSIDLNAHYLFPLANSPRFTPYVLGGLGILRYSVSDEVNGVESEDSDTNAGLNVGGGLRIAGGTNWGIRPELKFLIADDTSTRISVGFYYSFGR
jgi:opacity protein-like surface antigen